MNYGVVVGLKKSRDKMYPKVKVMIASQNGDNLWTSEKLISVLDRMIVLNEEQVHPDTLKAIRSAQIAKVQA